MALQILEKHQEDIKTAETYAKEISESTSFFAYALDKDGNWNRYHYNISDHLVVYLCERLKSDTLNGDL